MKSESHKPTTSKLVSVAILTATLLTPTLRAEEAGSGHYLPGATAAFIGVPPGKEGFVCVNPFTFYNGSVTAGKELELGDQLVLSANAAVYAGNTHVVAELKWLPELEVQKRLSGDTIWCKVAVVF
jgi:hypothetical protein